MFTDNKNITVVFPATEDNAKKVARDISVDESEFSVSFNEYLSLMGKQNKSSEPSSEALLECFEIFDRNGTGRISEVHFRSIMRGSLGEDAWELEEMLAEYRRLHLGSNPVTPQGEEYIDYNKFVRMLQQ